MTNRDNFHLLLGRYIAKTTRIEARINHIISAFFGNHVGPFCSDFDNWILGRIDMSDKIAVLSQITEFLDVKGEAPIKELFRGLGEMIERRNDIAHGHYMQVIWTDGVTTVDKGLGRPHRKTGHLDPEGLKSLDLGAFEHELTELDHLVVPLTDLFSRACDLRPWTSTTDGVVTKHEGTLEVLEQRQREQRAQKAALLKVEEEKKAERESRKNKGKDQNNDKS